MTTTIQDFYPAVSGSATVGKKAEFRPRFAGRVVSARLHVSTVGTGTLSWDVRINGVSVFSSTPTLSAAASSSSTFNTSGSADDFAANDLISVHVVSAAGTPPQDLAFQIKMEWDSADTFVAQAANRVLAGPSTGTDAVPTFRALVDADLPTGINAAKVADGSVSNTEFQYLNGVTSAVQTQLDGKAATSHTHAASDITSGTLDVARLPYTEIDGTLDGSGELSIAVSNADTKKIYGLAFSDEPSAAGSVYRIDEGNTTHLKFRSSNGAGDSGVRINGLYR